MSHWLTCPACGTWIHADHWAAHHAADHGDLNPPDLPEPRRWTPPARQPEDIEADRETDRLTRITERRLP